jgi:hypothetical protein
MDPLVTPSAQVEGSEAPAGTTLASLCTSASQPLHSSDRKSSSSSRCLDGGGVCYQPCATEIKPC